MMSDDNEPDDELNAGHYHEVMDRASLMANTWDREVEQLPATQAHPQLKEAAAKAGKALGDFYQVAGGVFFEMDEAEEKACPTDSKTPKQ